MATQAKAKKVANAVATVKRSLPVVREPETIYSLLHMAIDKNLDVERLRQLIDLRAQEEARQAKLAFDEHFSQMQAEFQAVKRSKQGYGYKYAPVEALQSAYGPIIAKHGFSYRWREEMIEGGVKRTIMTTSGWGHSQENTFDCPPLDGTERMNQVQIMGAMSTYGRRYTFIAGFGAIVEDEDDDGAPPKAARPPVPQEPPAAKPKPTDGLHQRGPVVESARRRVLDYLHRLVAEKIYTAADAKELEQKANRMSVLVPASAIAELAKLLASLPKLDASDPGLDAVAEKSFRDPSDEPPSTEDGELF